MSNAPRRGLPSQEDTTETTSNRPARAASASSRPARAAASSSILSRLPNWSPQLGSRVVKIAVPAIAALALTGTVAGAAAMRSAQSAEPVVAQVASQPTQLYPAVAQGSSSSPSASDTPTSEPSKASPSKEAPKKKEEAPKPAPKKSSPSPAKASAPAKPAGTRYATESVNVRAEASTDSQKVGALDVGDKVTITANDRDGWQQVLLGERARWVKAEYLSKERPKVSTPTPDADPTSPDAGPDSSDDPPSGSGSCNRSLGSKSGLSSSASRIWDLACGKFPAITSIGGTRGGSGSFHNEGRALDVMIGSDSGWAVARWARANASQLGVTQVIYSRKIWTMQRNGDGWRSMEDRGSTTQNHYDHVHISTK